MISKVKDRLYNNKDEIENILNTIGCTYIKQYKNSFKFGHDLESSGNANSLNIETLHYKSFSRDISGDIITLVSEMLNMNIGEAIKWLAKELHIKFEYLNKEVKLPFGGFFKQIKKIKDLDISPSIIYPTSRNTIYQQYGVSQLWVKDNISALTQEEFMIGYDILTNRITVPWFNTMGELVGIIGRINKKELTFEESKFKYFPIIAFNKGKNLFGLYQNYKSILAEGTIIVCESEKSVLKARDMGYSNVVAIGCKSISEIQAKLIKSMYCNVIIALDQGVPIEECIEQAKKVQINNPFFSNEVYIVDMNNELIVDDKIALFDTNKTVVEKMMRESLIYVD